MKKKSGTKRVLAVVLTIAMLLQNSAGVLATDSVTPVSEVSQEQSTEQQNTDAGNSQQETKAPETQAPETPAQTEAPQTNAPKTEATETDAPQTSSPETTTPETDAPGTNAPETQETPGLTQPDSETGNETSNGGSDNGTGEVSGSGSTAENGATGTESETVEAQTTAPEQSATEKETNGSAEIDVYTAKVENTSVQVKVRGEGVLPEGCAMTAEAVAASDMDDAAQTIAEKLHEEGQTLLGVEAFDITLLDENKTELHQLGGKVSVELEGLTVPEDAEQIYVYHVPEEGEPEQVKSLAREELADGILRFETDHFSVYAVAYVKGENMNSGIMPIAGEGVTIKYRSSNSAVGTVNPASEMYSEGGEPSGSEAKVTNDNYYFSRWAYGNSDGTWDDSNITGNLILSGDNVKKGVEKKHYDFVAVFAKKIKITYIIDPDFSGKKDELELSSAETQITSTKTSTDVACIATIKNSKNTNAVFEGWKIKSGKDSILISENEKLTYGEIYNGLKGKDAGKQPLKTEKTLRLLRVSREPDISVLTL